MPENRSIATRRTDSPVFPYPFIVTAGVQEHRRFMAYKTAVDGARFSSGRKGKREAQICLSFAVNVSRGVYVIWFGVKGDGRLKDVDRYIITT